MNVHMAYKAKSKLQVCLTLALHYDEYYQVYTPKLSKYTITYASYCSLPQRIVLGLPTKAVV